MKISGTVHTTSSNHLPPGLSVEALNKSIRKEALLATAPVTQTGTFSLDLPGPPHTGARPAPAIVLRVRDAADKELTRSPILRGLRTDDPIDLIIPDSALSHPSELEALTSAIAPHLEGLALADLAEDDIAFLAEATGLDRGHIALFAASSKLAKNTGLSADALYGLARTGIQATLAEVLDADPNGLRDALKRASEQNIVSSAAVDHADATVKRIEDLAIEDILGGKDIPGRGRLGTVLATSSAPLDAQKELLRSERRHRGNEKAVWDELGADPKTAGFVDELSTTLALSSIVQHHVPLLTVLQKRRRAGTLKNLRDLAKLGEGDWEALVQSQLAGKPVGTPPSIPGADDHARARQYARETAQAVERLFPTAFIAHRIRTDGIGAGRGRPRHDAKPIADFLDAHTDFDVLTTAIQPYLARHEKALDGVTDKNLFKHQLKALQRVTRLAQGVDIYNTSRVLLDAGLSSSQAIVRLGRAGLTHRYATSLGGAERAEAIYSAATATTEIAAVLSARVVTSRQAVPAAVSELVPLDDAAGSAMIPTWTELFGPADFCACEHCGSVYGPAAYLVDLLHFLDRPTMDDGNVLDVLLERRPDLAEIELTCKNTNTVLPYVDLVNELLENAVLKRDKHYQTKGVAEALAVQPEHTLTAAYDSDHLGGGAVYPMALPFSLWHEEARVYLGQLGVSRHELMAAFRMVGGPDETDIATEHLGLSLAKRTIIFQAPTEDVGDGAAYWNEEKRSGWETRLEKDVPRLLAETGLSLPELTLVLETKYVGADDPPITFGPTCDLRDARVHGLDRRGFTRLHRFVRLRRKLGWSTREVDRAISAFAHGKGLDDATLAEPLSGIVTLRDRHHLSVEDALSFYGTLDIVADEGGSSHYERIFLNPSVQNPVDAAFELTGMNARGATIPGHAPAVLAALRMSAEELAVLVPGVVSEQLRIGQLSALHRWVTLARVANLSVADTLALVNVVYGSSGGAAAFKDPAATLLFLDHVRFVKESPFTIGDLTDLLRETKPTSNRWSTREQRQALVDDLRHGLSRLAIDAAPGADAQDPRQRFVTSLLASRFGLGEPETRVLLTKVIRARPIAGPDTELPPEARTPVIDVLVVTEGGTASATQALLHLEMAALVVRTLSLSADELSWLATHRNDLVVLDFDTLPVGGNLDWPATFAAWRALVELAGFRDTLLPGQPRLLGIDLAPDPSATPEPCILDRTFDTTSTDWRSDVLGDLSTRTGWPLADLTAVADRLGFADAGDFRKPTNLLRIAGCFRLLRRMGVRPQEVFTWAEKSVDEQTAQRIRLAVKAKYTVEAWTVVARPLRDQLREMQRNALVAYLVPQRKLKDANALFGDMLIDVEMGSCMMTSRIKQAMSSVQLFTQRCIMGLVPECRLTYEGAWDDYRWMKNYRVWEAARKIFLYPENWIEPELRSDKTPFFEELETTLLQGELDQARAEDALQTYLERLREVSHLEIAGVHFEAKDKEKGPEEDVLHVVGRTRGLPHVYYYRKREGINWTPWTILEIGIEGDHLLPVVHGRRLYLFWPIFTAVADDPQPEGLTKAKQHWKIQLAYSQFDGRRWSAKKAAEDPLTDDKFDLPRSSYYLRAETSGDSLLVRFIRGTTDRNSSRSDTSPVGEQTWFYDPLVGSFAIDGCRTNARALDASGNDTIVSDTPPDDFTREYLSFASQEGGALRWYDGRGSWGKILSLRPYPARVAFPHQFQYRFKCQAPFFYEDDKRTFVVTPVRGNYPFMFELFYHPRTCHFVRELHRSGVAGLAPVALTKGDLDFEVEYGGGRLVLPPYPLEDIDFTTRGAYSIYNWELLFHAPLLIADKLRQEHRFEEAQRWFHYIFDPTTTSEVSAPERYWRFAPFAKEYGASGGATNSMLQLLTLLADEATADQELVEQVHTWRKAPFDPHAIARTRHVAYMKTVVMKYLDNLIEWGDDLFRRDTIESINEATQLYVLAAEILGDRPRALPAKAQSTTTFAFIRHRYLGEFSDPLIELEQFVPRWQFTPLELGGVAKRPQGSQPVPMLPTLLFCVPPNDKLWGYWDLVADRLFKIRHCRNIEGVRRDLPLFEPPIDPALLVRAAAAGLDIGEVLRELAGAAPKVRFQVALRRALELCADTRSLGAALLSALEKRDGEDMALLRSTHEARVLGMVKDVKTRQIDEATRTLEGLRRARVAVETRQQYYSGLRYKSQREEAQLKSLANAQHNVEDAANWEIAAHALTIVPDITVKTGLDWGVEWSFGGSLLSRGAQAIAGYYQFGASNHQHAATMSSLEAGFEWRDKDRKFQTDQAAKELAQLDQQILAAEIRVAIAERDRDVHDAQIANASEADDLLRSKFTNVQLYRWMVGQVSALHYQGYKLAYEAAKQAEQAYRIEIGSIDAADTFIGALYWDGLRSGLLAGERLNHDLRRLEAAYFDRPREHELTKHVSLAMIDPLALLRLRSDGECSITLPEHLFDRDYPGHINRRLKAVTLTIPSITGPYSGVNATLRLEGSWVRTGAEPAAYPDLDDSTGLHTWKSARMPDASIVTSSGRDDGGLFDMRLEGERLLPFEGEGAISKWRLELKPEQNQFDLSTVRDVILHLRYTAGPAVNQEAAKRRVQAEIGAGVLVRLFRASQDFSTAWHRFLHPDGTAPHTLVIDLQKERFPGCRAGDTMNISHVTLFVRLRDGMTYDAEPGSRLTLALSKGDAGSSSPSASELIPKDASQPLPYAALAITEPSLWTLVADLKDLLSGSDLLRKGTETTDGPRRLNPDAIEDLLFVVAYEVRSTLNPI